MDADDEKMQVMMMSRSLINNTQLIVDDEEEVLPGFRFHPTDQELVDFYLRRKVEKKPLNINLIKQIDIYKYDPWDLPHTEGRDLGEKEWYFFCRRGRKYRNSIRPNRVTGSGFWKATGIDRPIYHSNSISISNSSSSSIIIGLKKSLVYYRGTAGKGTKTEWMMHEFRLPPSPSQEAEVWTLCRILKRSVIKNLPAEWRELSSKRNITKTCNQDKQTYISFQGQPLNQHLIKHNHNQVTNISRFISSTTSAASSECDQATVSSSSFSDMNDLIKHGDWDELTSLVEFAAIDIEMGRFSSSN